MTSFLEIKESLVKVYPFSERQLDLFTEKMTHRSIKKKGLLLRRNEVCKELFFINSGSLRLYTATERGELTIHFFSENCWVADLESLLMQSPSGNQIEALEDTDMASISLRDIHALMDVHPCFRMLHALLANLTIPTSHLVSMNTKSPDERYKELLLNHPDWINRFPQMKIASYLGITPETLSRVRARIA